VHSVFTAKSIYNRSIEKQNTQTILPKDYGIVLVLRISPDAYRLLNRIQYSKLITYGIPFIKYFLHLIWNLSLKKEVRQWREINFEIVGINEPEKNLEFDDIFCVSKAEYDRIRELPEMKGDRKRVLIHTGSGWHVKLWDNKKWIETIDKINKLGEFDFIFIGVGEQEASSFEYIQRRLDFKVYSLVNRVDLKTSLLIMRLSDYFIGIDSGPRNMAHLADLRSVTLLGPAPKNFMPVNKADVVIDRFTCRCKSLFYFHKVSAIQSISADDVLVCFKSLLVSSSGLNEDSRSKFT
jgi:ADP-heptose:LPS heptosyltransferase